MPALSLLIKPASSLCNMRCRYCFYKDVADNRDMSNYGIMSEETLDKLVRRAFQYADTTCTFAFQGGEPTMAGLDFFRHFVDLETRYNIKGITVSNVIQTNGYIIDDEWAQFLAENKFLVGLSLDGDCDIHDALRLDAADRGTFNRVMHTAKLFEKYKVEFNILCVVTNFSARHGDALYTFYKKNGFRYIQFIQCLDPFDGKGGVYSLTPKRYGEFLNATFDRYYTDFKNNDYTSVRTFDNYITMLLGYPPESCGMSGECTCYFVVEGDGSVYPCDFYVLDNWRLGTIAEHSFEEMLHTNAAKKFVESSLPVSNECKECKWYQICRGGCRRCREPFVNGQPNLNRFCESYRMFFEHSYYTLGELARLSGIKRNH